ncbi:MAG: hypothetical protein K5920_07750 [Bacteroidales bacterium]|nr:hypothetical protein [Bacteroidales bacterium]
MRQRFLLILLFGVVLSVSAHNVVVEGNHYIITHQWTYDEREWECSLTVPIDLYEYYQRRTHQGDDFAHYVLSEFDRDYIRNLVQSFRLGGEKQGYSETNHVYNVICFVQSLRYEYDIQSKHEEDYVRYPLETLVDGEGDCEDMVVLAASILYEMGYGVLLVNLPDHLALAVRCSEDFLGTYYEYGGSRYYYLEMTSVGWDLGQIPERYKGVAATLIPVVNRPVVTVDSCYYQYDAYYLSAATVQVNMRCAITNLGPKSTQGLILHVLFKSYETATRAIKEQRFQLMDLPEGGSAGFNVKIDVPRPFTGVIEYRVEGANFDSKSLFVDGVLIQ